MSCTHAFLCLFKIFVFCKTFFTFIWTNLALKCFKNRCCSLSTQNHVSEECRLEEPTEVVWMKFICRHKKSHGYPLQFFVGFNQRKLACCVFTNGNRVLLLSGCICFMWIWLPDSKKILLYSLDVCFMLKRIQNINLNTQLQSTERKQQLKK